jgi:hypothetical protein
MQNIWRGGCIGDGVLVGPSAVGGVRSRSCFRAGPGARAKRPGLSG